MPANPEKHQWAPRPAMVAPEARCEDPVPRLRGDTLITVGAEGQHTAEPFKMGSEGCTGVPQGQMEKLFLAEGTMGQV